MQPKFQVAPINGKATKISHEHLFLGPCISNIPFPWFVSSVISLIIDPTTAIFPDKAPATSRANIMECNDWLNPKHPDDIVAPVKPMRRTGLRPIRSESEDQKYIYFGNQSQKPMLLRYARVATGQGPKTKEKGKRRIDWMEENNDCREELTVKSWAKEKDESTRPEYRPMLAGSVIFKSSIIYNSRLEFLTLIGNAAVIGRDLYLLDSHRERSRNSRVIPVSTSCQASAPMINTYLSEGNRFSYPHSS